MLTQQLIYDLTHFCTSHFTIFSHKAYLKAHVHIQIISNSASHDWLEIQHCTVGNYLSYSRFDIKNEIKNICDNYLHYKHTTLVEKKHVVSENETAAGLQIRGQL